LGSLIDGNNLRALGENSDVVQNVTLAIKNGAGGDYGALRGRRLAERPDLPTRKAQMVTTRLRARLEGVTKDLS
jgi:hypothetical protein